MLDIEVSLLMRYVLTLLLPIIYLYILATYIFARSAHLKLARILAAFISSIAIAYTIDLIRVFAPTEVSYILQIYVIKFFIHLSFAFSAHMLYEIVKPLGHFAFKKIIYLFYLAPVCLTILSVLQISKLGAPTYIKEDGWIYRLDYDLLLVNTIIVLVFYANNIIIIIYGFIRSDSFAFKRLFRVLAVFSAIVAITSVLYYVNLFSIDYILPPTRSLFLCLISATLLMLFVMNLDFMPSTIKKYAALMNSSPTPIIHLDNQHMILEQNTMANFTFKMEPKTYFHEFFDFENNQIQYNLLFKQLEEQDHVKGFEVSYLGADGQSNYVLIDGSRIQLGQQNNYYIMLHDVTLQFRNTKLNEYYAYHDSLTGIHNRVYFEQHAKEALANMPANAEAAFILTDLNFFKQINDTYGHQVGDEILVKVAHLLQESLMNPHMLARLGGDEFVIFIEGVESKAQIEKMLEEVRAHFTQNPYEVHDGQIEIVPSFGLAYASEQAQQYEKLYHAADLQMYKDKHAIKQLYKMTNIEKTGIY